MTPKELELTGLSADHEWVGLLNNLVKFGRRASPRGLEVREIVSHQSIVQMEYPVVTNSVRRVGYRFMVAEAFWILSGRNDVAFMRKFSTHIESFSNDGVFFDGAYGPKVVDQLRYVCDCLAKDIDSRQAVIEIWRPNPRDSKDVPCTLSLQWLVRDGKIHCIDTMRSSDAWLGWPYDIFSFTALTAYITLMLRYRCERKIQLGNIYLNAGSQHYYVDPVRDGAKNIPYDETRLKAIVEGPSFATKYAKLSLDDYSSPEAFMEYLSSAALGKLEYNTEAKGPWLKELFCPDPATVLVDMPRRP